MENQLVVFDLMNEHYGVDITAVESIITMQAITSIPQTPLFVEGVINLRGEVLPVVDLRKRFGLTSTDITRNTRIIVVNVSWAKVGMIVDAVSEVLRVSEQVIETLSPLVMTVNSAFIQGIVKVDERMIILLDLDRVFTDQESVTLQPLSQAVSSPVNSSVDHGLPRRPIAL